MKTQKILHIARVLIANTPYNPDAYKAIDILSGIINLTPRDIDQINQSMELAAIKKLLDIN